MTQTRSIPARGSILRNTAQLASFEALELTSQSDLVDAVHRRPSTSQAGEVNEKSADRTVSTVSAWFELRR
jgi:hypothetical protein